MDKGCQSFHILEMRNVLVCRFNAWTFTMEGLCDINDDLMTYISK